ncbi:Haloacid dehalogenase domain protein hydrolase [Stackebrandtia nassauensis DSM 44728]|uniref:Haloacid dehalogenase domain protein hydrolase n=2 Tax=Stackebrandtia TaxID=283810 RepID=D3Q376_STANL|nr:Haloacid dehalogenase domain protein hydrolase [Stackebrandtia nassauensis DSM 44728]
MLCGSGPLLLDFDGPVCGVFAGDPSPRIALGISRIVEATGIEVPLELREHSMELLSWVDTLDVPGLTETVEDALSDAELRAVQTASPTPFAREVIEAAHRAAKPVAVVSNNSASSISAYLRAQELDEYVWPIVGRPYANPSEMKPNPIPLLRAAESLNVEPETCVFVGDSVFDIEAGLAAKTPVIGYANASHKTKTLADAGAKVIIRSMGDLVSTLQNCPTSSQGAQ